VEREKINWNGNRGKLAVVGVPLISVTKEEVKVEKTNPLEGDRDVGGAEEDGGSEDE